MPWWPPEQWESMVAGVDCAMCADAHVPVNPHGELIAELPGSYARLCRNQTKAGYTAVIAKRHAAELFALDADELRLFWADVAEVARAVFHLFAPVKIDYLVMGHLCPHVHCHVYPQYRDDDPHGLLNPQDGDIRLSEPAWAERVRRMRDELGVGPPDRMAG